MLREVFRKIKKECVQSVVKKVKQGRQSVKWRKAQLIEVNGYEAWQNSLFYVFFRFFGHNPAQTQ